MALKNVIKPYHLMTDGSMAGNLTTDPVDVVYSDNVGFQLIFTGTPTGTFQCQGSIDNVNWTNLEFSTVPSATGAADTHLFNLNNVPYRKLRVGYTRTSGTGTLNVWVMAKTVGG